MKPFAAWLAMMSDDVPAKRLVRESWVFAATTLKAAAERMGARKPQPVLIVPDTEENRRKLGMGEA